ncbi:MAG: RagB/SusD family nutrient uptake outer membrane protein [Prevotella sp.]|nr:RagB/SusD family nutrient uptake outer membrane protein [Prevotella sp.]MCI1549941.1 RagB/SusD family nutrient uptake outer membrane protein [Prevotella sp.]MCI2088347.1 RagB/SusD family nutrient uptake outer membrane protein [Prevotella sp.]MCI2125903.1 RagB/SusD family nutrient uptake outer membrane protein [Prevotella sp.]
MNKNIKFIIWGTIACLMSSCSSDLLNLNNPNALTSETAFNTEADLNSSLTGIYHQFYCSWYAQLNSNQFSGQSDEMISYSTADIQQYCNLIYSNKNVLWNDTGWDNLYAQIARCNQVICNADNVASWSTYNKNMLVAQARAIRAYDYYQLAMMYQVAPYVDYVAKADDQPAQSTFSGLCQHIIADADSAYKYLPASYSDNYTGPSDWKGQYRVTKWFAACVAAKTYMNWGDYLKGDYHYKEALPYFKDIIDNGGFQLCSNYSDNFNIYTENNSESIFEIQNEASSNGWRNYYGWDNNQTTPSQSQWHWKFYAPSPLGWTDFNAERWILPAFKNEMTKETINGSNWDQRIPATIFYAGIFKDFPNHVQWQTWTATKGKATADAPVSTDTPGFSWKDWDSSRVYINKYTAQYEDYSKVNSDNSEGTNYRIFRLGEIMLDYAECLAQTGDLKGAVDMINKVRNRAGLCDLGERQKYAVTDIYKDPDTGETIDFNNDYGYPAFYNNSTSYTLSDIMKVLDIESMKESCFECERLVNLRRWGISRDNDFLNRVKKRALKYEQNFTPVRAWIPMPTHDVDNNPNLKQLDGF